MREESSRTHDVYLNYSSKDKTWADAACAVLERHRIRCWIAPRDITPGDEWGAAIIKGLNGSRIMVLIFSGHANASKEVHRAVERASSQGMTILTVRVEDVRPDGAMEYYLGNRHWLDVFAPPVEQKLELLVRSVKTLLGNDVESPVAPAQAHRLRPSFLELLARSVKTLLGHDVESAAPHAPANPPGLREGVPRPSFKNRPTQILRAQTRRIALRVLQLVRRRPRAMDPVDCSVFAPPSVMRGGLFVVLVFAHRPDQTEEARGLAGELDEEARRRGFQSLEMEIERGTRLKVHLHLPGIEFNTPIQDILWLGRPTYVAFKTRVPEEVTIGIVIGSVTISRAGVPIGSIMFKIKILGDEESRPTRNPLLPAGKSARRYRKAFISYASPDRPEVLKRVQMLRLARIRYFQDVLKLEPGDRWERMLYRHIDKSDLFLLFWSTNAKESKWVLEEVRYALKRKQGDESAPPEMIPVIIEGPPVPMPPDELAHLHFNDYVIYFMKP